MQVSREAVLRQRRGIEEHDRADLPAVTNTVGDHVHQHLLARHAARRAVGELEVDLLRQLVAIERRHVVDILPVAVSHVR